MEQQLKQRAIRVIFKILLFVLIGETIYSILPQILWSLMPDFLFLKGAAKGSMVTVFLLILLTYYFLFSEHKNLATIGLEWRTKRALQLIAGISIGVVMNALIAFSLAWLFNFKWQLNNNLNIATILIGLFLNCWSAIAEELIYRGYAFKKSVERFGKWKTMGAFISLFAIIHIFAWGAWGDPNKMLSVFCTTGLGGLLFSIAFLRTGSIALPSGLHMGFIWANADFFTGMFARWYNDKQGLFVPVNTNYYNTISQDNWVIINSPYFVVLMVAVFFVSRIRKQKC